MSNEGVEEQESLRATAGMPIEATRSADIRLPAIEPDGGLETSMGSRLRIEREKRGWTCEDVAARLKLQARLIRLIENDDYAGISHAVYLRGYLTSYARLLGLPSAQAERVVAEVSQQAPLVSTGKVSRSRYLVDRYSVSATYLILTGLVIGPAVWLATHGGLEQNLARTVMLDGPTAAMESADPAVTPVPSGGLRASPDPTRDPAVLEPRIDAPSSAPTDDTRPIVASMAPFTGTSATPESGTTGQGAAPGGHSLTLKLAQPSWVEITSSSGEKLEYGLLEGGVERTYSSDTSIAVRIGNAKGAEIIADGEAVDLAPFQRANVAHLRVFADGKLASRIDS